MARRAIRSYSLRQRRRIGVGDVCAGRALAAGWPSSGPNCPLPAVGSPVSRTAGRSSGATARPCQTLHVGAAVVRDAECLYFAPIPPLKTFGYGPLS